MTTQTWWERLPEDFHLQPDSTPLDAVHPFKVYSTAALDHFGRMILGGMIVSGVVPVLLSRQRAERERERQEFYARYSGATDLAEVFRAPPAGVQVQERPVGAHGFRPAQDIPCTQLSFESPFVPLHPDLKTRWARHSRNRVASAQYWRHPHGPRPTLIFTHGFFADPHWLNSLMFSLPWFYAQGYDIVLYTLPFHGARRGRCEPFSGYGFVGGGVASINESMLQSVCDLRVLVSELYRRGAPSVGVSGLSLGGYVSALLACVEPRLAFCIPNSPVVVPVDMGLEWLTTRHAMRASMRRQGIGVRELREAMALHCPLSYVPRIDPRRVLIIGGAGDRFTPPRYVRLLHEHWPGSHLHWFPGNHVIHLQRGFYLRLMKDFMDRHTLNFSLQ